MRFTALAVAAFALLPVIGPAGACEWIDADVTATQAVAQATPAEAVMPQAAAQQPAADDLAAKSKKNKKKKAKKKPKDKDEYMKSAAPPQK
ncbi:MAG TPA: hypothetical protein VHD14_07660 [Pseudolabrys sp.]|jgi:hypothetical protein|nr:hypothetical protein [Pseudolabrys sp.]